MSRPVAPVLERLMIPYLRQEPHGHKSDNTSLFLEPLKSGAPVYLEFAAVA